MPITFIPFSSGESAPQGGHQGDSVAFDAIRSNLEMLKDGVESIATTSKTPINAVAADGVVTFSGTPVADETLTIGTQVFTFKATRTVAYQITIDADNTAQGDNLVTAITADLTNVTAVNVTGTVTITAVVKGVVGNLIALAESATGTAVSGVTGGKLDGGVDGTVGVENELASDGTYLYVAIAANTTADRNWRRIALGSVY